MNPGQRVYEMVTSTEENNGSQDWLQFDEALCERYLFGELTEPEQERFEEAYFDDDVFFDRFIAVKTELLDLYARGELDPEKRARMEPHFMATAPRRKRLEESREFIQVVNKMSDRDSHTPVVAPLTAPTEPSFLESLVRFFTLPRLAGAAALLVAAIGVIYLVSRERQDGATDTQFAQQPRPTVTPAANARPSILPDSQNQPAPAEVTVNPPDSINSTPRTSPSPKSEVTAQPKPKRPKPVVPDETNKGPEQKYVASDPQDRDDETTEFTIPQPSITLRAGATRDIGIENTLEIPAGARSASITLLFRRGGYPRYIVTITTVEGTEVFRRAYDKRLASDGRDGFMRLSALLGASKFGEKDYIVKLEGHFPGEAPETIEEYYFHVRRVKEEPAKKP
jgi:hypothetical protein